jgi:hypothetical protein
MLSLSNPRKPAPILACGGIGLRLHVGPNAFGNALGNSLAQKLQETATEELNNKQLFSIAGPTSSVGLKLGLKPNLGGYVSDIQITAQPESDVGVDHGISLETDEFWRTGGRFGYGLSGQDPRSGLSPKYYPSMKPGRVYSPRLGINEVATYFKSGAKAAGTAFVDFFVEDIPNMGAAVWETVSDPFGARPLEALEKGGIALQARAGEAAMAAANGDFTLAGEMQGQFVGSSAAGGATSLLAAKAVQTISEARRAAAAERLLQREQAAIRVENNFGADSGYVPYQISIMGFPGTGTDVLAAAHPYFYTGHVGFSFDFGDTILGHGPRASGSVSEVIVNLKNGRVYPGEVTDDTQLFRIASQSNAPARSRQLGTQAVWKLDMPVTRQQFDNARLWTQQRGLKNALPEHPYSFKTGGVCVAPYNCATYPSTLGIPLPHINGQVSEYIPAMIKQGAEQWKKKPGG